MTGSRFCHSREGGNLGKLCHPVLDMRYNQQLKKS